MSGLEKRILIIDDSESFLKVFSAMLSSLGYYAKGVSDCFEGLRLLKDEIFDLVILDMIMPQIGGLLMITVIRQDHPKIPILAISGFYDMVLKGMKEQEIDGILGKPIRLRTLRTALNNIFRRKDATKPPKSRPSANSSLTKPIQFAPA